MTIPVLFKRHFQVAYVVDNAKAAMDLFAGGYGVTKWDLMDMTEIHGAQSPVRFIATAWVGDTMIELIEPVPQAESIYRDWQRGSANPLRFHHLGFLVDNAEEFEAAKQQLAAIGAPIVMDGSFGEVLDFAYADTRSALGHYYEIIRLKADGASFFDRVPVN